MNPRIPVLEKDVIYLIDKTATVFVVLYPPRMAELQEVIKEYLPKSEAATNTALSAADRLTENVSQLVHMQKIQMENQVQSLRENTIIVEHLEPLTSRVNQLRDGLQDTVEQQNDILKIAELNTIQLNGKIDTLSTNLVDTQTVITNHVNRVTKRFDEHQVDLEKCSSTIETAVSKVENQEAAIAGIKQTMSTQHTTLGLHQESLKAVQEVVIEMTNSIGNAMFTPEEKLILKSLIEISQMEDALQKGMDELASVLDTSNPYKENAPDKEKAPNSSSNNTNNSISKK